MSVLILLFWAVVAGYVTAGILASLYQWLTSEPVSFKLLVTGGLGASLVAMPLLLLSGPAVIARNAWRGRVIEGRAWSWIMASAVIVAGWSFVNGVIVLEFLLSLRGGLS